MEKALWSEWTFFEQNIQQKFITTPSLYYLDIYDSPSREVSICGQSCKIIAAVIYDFKSFCYCLSPIFTGKVRSLKLVWSFSRRVLPCPQILD